VLFEFSKKAHKSNAGQKAMKKKRMWKGQQNEKSIKKVAQFSFRMISFEREVFNAPLA
jgi:hypothetical protein